MFSSRTVQFLLTQFLLFIMTQISIYINKYYIPFTSIYLNFLNAYIHKKHHSISVRSTTFCFLKEILEGKESLKSNIQGKCGIFQL